MLQKSGCTFPQNHRFKMIQSKLAIMQILLVKILNLHQVVFASSSWYLTPLVQHKKFNTRTAEQAGMIIVETPRI